MHRVSLPSIDMREPIKNAVVESHTPVDDRLLIPLEDVCRLVGLGRSQIYAMVREGNFPGPVRLGRRCSRWRMASVRDWVDRL